MCSIMVDTNVNYQNESVEDLASSKFESEDSSYDSDYESSELRTREQLLANKHQDVSRTSSDTLGAEFAEYVNVEDKKLSADEDSEPVHVGLIEFALKLGYTEKQAEFAIKKVGAKAGENAILTELIKLGSSSKETKTELERKGSLTGLISQQPSAVKKPEAVSGEAQELRSIVIDGSNLAMSHGNKEVFSCHGIKLCVEWFKNRGHKDITVFVPKWRKEVTRPENIVKDSEILVELERERLLVFTPSRQMGGRRMACHDDRYILKLAAETDGIVVSNDNYRDLASVSEFKKVIEERLLMYSFVNDRFMPPDDPLGRHGPNLDNFLRVQKKSQDSLQKLCPYGKKCTYGNKCKYFHPERGNQPHKTVSELLAEQAKINLQARGANKITEHEGNQLKGTMSLPLPNSSSEKAQPKKKLTRTKSLLPQNAESPMLVAEDEMRNLESKPQNAFSFSSLHTPLVAYPPSQQQQPMCEPDLFPAESHHRPNEHKKLQRQLTLNPVYDPRLAHLKSVSGFQQSEHSPLTRHSSAGAAESASARVWAANHHKNTHQAVTRIASAPDAFHKWHSQSQPQPQQLAQQKSYMWMPISQQAAPSAATGMLDMLNVPMTFNEKRNHMFYHLSSLFPVKYVQAAMDLYPDEIDPAMVCSAILQLISHPN